MKSNIRYLKIPDCGKSSHGSLRCLELQTRDEGFDSFAGIFTIGIFNVEKWRGDNLRPTRGRIMHIGDRRRTFDFKEADTEGL